MHHPVRGEAELIFLSILGKLVLAEDQEAAMTRYLSLVVASLVSLGAFADDIDVCATVPAADVEAAFGFKVIKTQKGNRECQWFASPTIFAQAGTTAAIKNPKLPDTKVLLAGFTQQGWKPKVTDDTPTLWCFEGVASGSPVVNCHAIGKSRQLTLIATGQGMNAAKAKAFISKFIARLP